MLQASVKEYELLDKEVQTIRDCITRYIGYIIGSNGIAYLMFGIPQFNKYIQPDIVLGVVLVIVTAIYYILDYKFASHNRYIGYRQLLSQEIFHVNIEKPQPISGPDIDKGYISAVQKCLNIPENIFSWDYIQSKWNNRTKSKQYPESYYNKLDARLQLPDDYKSFYVAGVDKGKNTIQLFFENIIWKGFKLWPIGKFYSKFTVTSWRYPKYIFMLAVLLIIFSLFLFNIFSGFPLLWIITLDTLIGLCWLTYLLNLFRLLKGDKTIDFYCWAFLSFRIKLLNNYGIRPIYHSTSFQRYYKSLKIAEFIVTNKTRMETDYKKINIDQVIGTLKKGNKLTGEERKAVKEIKEIRKNKTAPGYIFI